MSRAEACAAVNRAIMKGALPTPATLDCVDCGKPAQVYDHFRGYAVEHWLDVEPVCIRDNAVRAGRGRRERAAPPELLTACLMRIPDELVEALDREAEENLRSRNGQLIWILRERFGGSVKEDEEIYST